MMNTMAIKKMLISANNKSNGVMDSMILAGIPIAICYWFLDSILQIFFSGKYNFIAVFFGPNLYEIYTRVTVLCLFIIFGSHAQNIINKIRETREELHESEEKYRTVADFTYDWEYWIGEKGNFEYVSPSCERISGYRADAFLKNPGLLNQIIHPVDRDAVSDHFRTELVRRAVQSSEFRIITRDNRERWIGHVCQPVYGTDGRYRGKRASNKDITAIKNEIEERKRVEAKMAKYRDHLEDLVKERSSELLKTNAKLKAEVKERKLTQKALEASHNFLLIAFRPRKLQPLLIEFVRAIQSQTGLTAAGVQLFDTIKKAPLKFYAGFNQKFYESLSRPSMPSVRNLGTSGNRKAIFSDLYSCSDSGSYYISSTTDLLYHHPNERDANIIRLFNESGFESVGLIPFHLENNIYGYIHVADSRKNMINIQVLELLESGAMQLETAVKRIQAEAALQKSHQKLKTRVKNRSKELEVANKRLKREVAERRRAEKELQQKEKPASLGILVSSIAHEINNPNNFVSSNIPILKDYIDKLIPLVDRYVANQPDIEFFHMSYPDFRQDIYKLLENIEHGADRIDAYVKKLREFSRGDEEKFIKRVALKPVIEKSISSCLGKIKKSIRSFKLVIPDNLPPIYTDPYALEQILINLLENAVQASNKKDSWIELSVSMETTGRAHLLIEIRDNGRGMNAETRQHVFDPLFTTDSIAASTGLGLYICHNLARDLGGGIEVDSQPGVGSKFTIILPVTDKK